MSKWILAVILLSGTMAFGQGVVEPPGGSPPPQSATIWSVRTSSVLGTPASVCRTIPSGFSKSQINGYYASWVGRPDSNSSNAVAQLSISFGGVGQWFDVLALSPPYKVSDHIQRDFNTVTPIPLAVPNEGQMCIGFNNNNSNQWQVVGMWGLDLP